MLNLDSEQKRVLRVICPSALGFVVGYPLLLLVFGKLDSWKEALMYVGVGLLIGVLMCVFYLLGSKIPRKDKQNRPEN